MSEKYAVTVDLTRTYGVSCVPVSDPYVIQGDIVVLDIYFTNTGLVPDAYASPNLLERLRRSVAN